MGQTIGVLALQGAFVEQVKRLESVGVCAREVRKSGELAGLDGLIIPGGESTSMGLIAKRWGLVEPLRQWIESGRPTWGTCAGMILLSQRAVDQKVLPVGTPEPRSLPQADLRELGSQGG